MKMSEETIDWYGDLDDDCCAQWCGMLLRAEWMHGGNDEETGQTSYWWWAVSSIETGAQLVAPPNMYAPFAHSGVEARNYAEAAARSWAVAKGYNKYSPLKIHNKRNLKMRPL